MEKLTLQSHGASELSFKDRYEALDKIPTPKQSSFAGLLMQQSVPNKLFTIG